MEEVEAEVVEAAEEVWSWSWVAGEKEMEVVEEAVAVLGCNATVVWEERMVGDGTGLCSELSYRLLLWLLS